MYSKADTHMHTTCSDGLMSPEETIDYIATQTELSVVAVTDHNTAEGGLIAHAYAQSNHPQLHVIVGEEISTPEGEVIGLFLQETLPRCKTARGAIDAIHEQGGLAVAVHPFSRWNTMGNMRGVGKMIFELPLDAVEVRNGFPSNIISNPMAALLNRYKGQRLPELGGSDSHVPFTVGQSCTWFPGRTAADFRQAILDGTVRAGGGLWSIVSIARLIPVLLERGMPHHQHPTLDRENQKNP